MANKPPKRWPPKEEDVLPHLPKDVREHFMSLDPQIRAFLLNATEQEREVFLALPRDEMYRFPKLTPHQRSSYLRLSPREKKLLLGMSDAQRQSYLTLPAEQRSTFAASTATGQAQAQQAQRVQTQTRTLLDELVSAFSPWTDAPELRTRVHGALYNALSAGVDASQARTLAIRALVSDPSVEREAASAIQSSLPNPSDGRFRADLSGLLSRHAGGAKDRSALIAAAVAELQTIAR